MKYRLKIADEMADLEISHPSDECSLRISIRDKVYDVHYQVISQNHFHMLVNGRASQVFVVPAETGKHIFVNGRSFLVHDADQLPLRRARGIRAGETPGEVTPPMPAIVVRILVQEGDRVEKGQGLVVVSAMKMETTLVAPSTGRVKKINTSADEKVMPGDILVEIEEEVLEDE